MQYLSIRYTERLAEAGVATSVGSRGDSHDNVPGGVSDRALHKAELVHRRVPGAAAATSRSRHSADRAATVHCTLGLRRCSAGRRHDAEAAELVAGHERRDRLDP